MQRAARCTCAQRSRGYRSLAFIDKVGDSGVITCGRLHDVLMITQHRVARRVEARPEIFTGLEIEDH